MRIALVSVLLALAACGSPAPETGAAQTETISSTDFALLPCGVASADPCVLVKAGGKRILLGAPAGIAAALAPDDLGQLDAVMLFSLRAGDLQGLDELRNESWRAGRDQPLTVSGPPGTREVLAAINSIYETSDALIFVEQGGAGGFDAPILRPAPNEKDTKARVFDTGDLVVTHLVNADGRVGYWVDYNGQRVVIEPCGMVQALKFAENIAYALVCDLPEDTPGAGWPLTDLMRIPPEQQ